ncbi:MAG: Hsp20/alpha crystallin family protein [Candidatus Atabeyarchaeum deiterrae]
MNRDFFGGPFGFRRPFRPMHIPQFRNFGHLLFGARIEEDAENLKVALPLPGYSKDDFDLSVGPDALILTFKEKETSESKESAEGEEEEFQGPMPWMPFTGPLFGSVKRIPLPVDVDPDTARAKLENGVLRVTVKKKNPENEKKVSVE